MKNLFIAAMMMSLFFVSCQKATHFESDITSITCKRSGDKIKLTLSSDATNYDVDYAPEWIETELNNNILTVTISENTTRESREDYLKVTCGGIRLSIPVAQAYLATKLVFEDGTDNASLNFGIEGGGQTLGVITDGDNVSVSCIETFCNASYSDGKLTVNVDPNTEGSKFANITLTSDNQTAYVSVTQEAAICSRCNGKGRITCPDCKGSGWIDSYVAAGGSCTRCGGSGGSVGRMGRGWIKCPDCKNR